MKTKVLRIFLIIIGLLSLANVGLMYLIANPTIGFTLQAIISICVILYAIFFNKLNKKIHIAIISVAFIPIAFSLFLMIYGNISNANYQEDVVIVLGAGINGETVSRPLAHRLDRTIEYFNQNPNSTIIVTGGLGNRAVITEAEAMARYLVARGVPRESILLEEKSTSTYENLSFAKEILEEHFPNGFNAVLITNDFHIYRSVSIARQAGLDVNRLGAYTDWYTWGINYLREMVAIINHKLSLGLTRNQN
ncbi:MAG: YdcF family protein [Defluviitaleaceae bacterium]|nr:YdcF family protein [Defluviitaleaceae bacterium]